MKYLKKYISFSETIKLPDNFYKNIDELRSLVSDYYEETNIMKYLQTYEEFKQQLYTVGDLVKLDTGDVAKITKINSKNSYLVTVMFNQQFSKEPIEIRENQIVDLVKSNNAPAIGTDMTINPSTNPSNDMAINGGFPDTPLSNPMNI